MISQTYSRQKSSLLQQFLFHQAPRRLEHRRFILVKQKCVSKEIAQALKPKT